MDEKDRKPQTPPAAGVSQAAPTPAAPAAASELDLTIETIERPELMKEGFVGQER